MTMSSCRSYYYPHETTKYSLTEEQRDQLTVKTVKINTFTCVDPIIAEAVQNIFIAELAQMDIGIVREGEADLIINGTITTTYDESLSGKSSSLGWGGVSASPQSGGGGFIGGGQGSFAQSSGYYVSGVTSLADFKGRIVASGNFSQRRVGGNPPYAPEEIAKRAAGDLKWKLQSARSQRKILF